jgi:hypothetical protein
MPPSVDHAGDGRQETIAIIMLSAKILSIFASFETVYRREKHLLGAEAPVYS